jgi:hypothetical protein
VKLKLLTSMALTVLILTGGLSISATADTFSEIGGRISRANPFKSKPARNIGRELSRGPNFQMSKIQMHKKSFKICGNHFEVPAIAYAACHGAIYMLPASCTVGATTSAGTACALDISLAASACGISFGVLAKVANDCIAGK